MALSLWTNYNLRLTNNTPNNYSAAVFTLNYDDTEVQRYYITKVETRYIKIAKYMAKGQLVRSAGYFRENFLDQNSKVAPAAGLNLALSISNERSI